MTPARLSTSFLIASTSTHDGVAWRRIGEAATISRQAKYKLSRAMHIASAGSRYWMLSKGTLHTSSAASVIAESPKALELPQRETVRLRSDTAAWGSADVNSPSTAVPPAR